MSQMQHHQATALAVIQKQGTSIHSQHGYADMYSTEAQDMFRARLVRGRPAAQRLMWGQGLNWGRPWVMAPQVMTVSAALLSAAF